jgi:hypothetical protein
MASGFMHSGNGENRWENDVEFLGKKQEAPTATGSVMSSEFPVVSNQGE